MHRTESGILGSFLVIFGIFITVVTFGTLEMESLFSTLGIIPTEVWYIWFTLAHFTFGTPVGTLDQLQLLQVWKNKRPPYWSSSFLYDFDQTTVISELFCIKLTNFAPIWASAVE